MSNEQIQELLIKLHNELSHVTLDDKTRDQLRSLDCDINNLLSPEIDAAQPDSLIATAQTLETHFAIKHPLAERCMREIIDALARMGI
jgi:hypothetical protein